MFSINRSVVIYVPDGDLVELLAAIEQKKTFPVSLFEVDIYINAIFCIFCYGMTFLCIGSNSVQCNLVFNNVLTLVKK